MESRYEYGPKEPAGLPAPEKPAEPGGEKSGGGAPRGRLRAAVCGILFIAVFGAKAAFPDSGLDERLLGLIDGGWDYRAAIEAVGSLDVEGGLSAVVSLLGGEEGAAEPALAANGAYHMAQSALTDALPVYGSAAEGEIPAAPADAEPGPAEAEAEQKNAAVEAFLESQSEYEDMGLPAGVTFDMPELGVECAAPLAGTVTDSFGWRVHPLDELVKFHYGTDIGVEEGAPIASVADGTVYAAGDSTSLGLYLIIDHGGGVRSQYAHCSELLARAGDEVALGQEIALAGSTGSSTGPHLHIELTKDGEYLNPEYYMDMSGEGG